MLGTELQSNRMWKDWPHVLRMQQFSADNLEAIIAHALVFEEAQRKDCCLPRLSREQRRRADDTVTRRCLRSLFYQASTRTEATFFNAAQELGCIVHLVKDPQAFSSAQKGESFDLALMAYTCAGGLGMLRGCDGVIIRNKTEGTAQRAADIIATALREVDRHRPIFVINAGDGKRGQHPTQALVDLTTIAKQRADISGHFLDGLTVLFPGDVGRSRVVNSLLYAFGRFDDRARIKVIFCNPEGLGPCQEMLLYLARHGIEYYFVGAADFRDAIPQADVVYMTRLQREYDDDDDIKIPPFNRHDFVFRRCDLALLQPESFVMHPLPINEDPSDPPPEIDGELKPLAIAGHRQLVFGQQSQRGIPTRAALLDLIFAELDALADSQ